MIYKFKSKAAGDVIMMGPTGDQILRAAGRQPSAQGIFEPDSLPAAMADIEKAILSEEAERADAEAKARAEGQKLPPAGITLRQRAWPLVEMMKRSQSAGVPVVWGV
jgi:regulator of protease activity HflC (stomatin/prohibitin superfamily)